MMDLIPSATRAAWDAAWKAMSPEARAEFNQLRRDAVHDLDKLFELLQRLTDIRLAALMNS